MIDGKHGVRLAAAESGLELNDRVAALAVETAGNGCEQQAHSLGNERALEKCRRVLIFPRGLAGVNRGDVRGELGLLKRAFKHVRVRHSNFSPGFHGISFRWVDWLAASHSAPLRVRRYFCRRLCG